MKRKTSRQGSKRSDNSPTIIFKTLKEVINMEKVIMVGCDAHSENLLLMCALGKGAADKVEYSNVLPQLK